MKNSAFWNMNFRFYGKLNNIMTCLKRMAASFFSTLVIFLFVLFNLAPDRAYSQSLPGTSGYFNIPSADIYPDKTMYFGASLLHKDYKKWGNPDYHAMGFYVTTTFIPRVEISIRYSRMIDLPSDQYESTVGDRMASARVQALKEGKYYPSVVLAVQNFFTTLQSGSASHFNSSYIVASKNIRTSWIIDRVGLTVGYGAEIFKSADYQFIGLFYGLSISPKNMDYLEMMLEYDAEKWNAGMRLTVLKHIVILVGFEGMDAFSGGLSYKFLLP